MTDDVPRCPNGAPDLTALMAPAIQQVARAGGRLSAEVSAECDGEQVWAEPGIQVPSAPSRLRLVTED